MSRAQDLVQENKELDQRMFNIETMMTSLRFNGGKRPQFRQIGWFNRVKTQELSPSESDLLYEWLKAEYQKADHKKHKNELQLSKLDKYLGAKS